MVTEAGVRARLTFRLPGVWSRVRLDTMDLAREDITEHVRLRVGRDDSLVEVRRHVRAQLLAAATRAQEANGRAMYLGHELVPGTPLPLSITVYEPDNLRMSPAVGTEPKDVVAALENTLARLAPPVMDTTHVTGQDFRALRTIARTTESWSPEQSETSEPAPTSRGTVQFAWTADAQREARNTQVGVLRVDYWCTSPLSKDITLVVMTAPFGAIENAAVSLFDAIIGAASYSSTA